MHLPQVALLHYIFLLLFFQFFSELYMYPIPEKWFLFMVSFEFFDLCCHIQARVPFMEWISTQVEFLIPLPTLCGSQQL